jgi:hypothetical protein
MFKLKYGKADPIFVLIFGAILYIYWTVTYKIFILSPIIMFLSSIWVYLDAKKLEVDRYDKYKKPTHYFMGAMLAWIIWFPFYLYKRSAIINGLAALKPDSGEQ